MNSAQAIRRWTRNSSERRKSEPKREKRWTKDFITHQTTNLQVSSLCQVRLLSLDSRKKREATTRKTTKQYAKYRLTSFSWTLWKRFELRLFYDFGQQCATASRNKSSNDLFIQIKLTREVISCIMEYLRAYCFPFRAQLQRQKKCERGNKLKAICNFQHLSDSGELRFRMR